MCQLTQSDVILSNGTVVKHKPLVLNGKLHENAVEAYVEGREMTDAEWKEYSFNVVPRKK